MVNKVCHLCRVLFTNYKKHINSENHKKMIQENNNCYKDLSDTFKRIVNNNNNWKNENKSNEKDNYYCLRNKRGKFCKKYWDDYILLNDINTIMKNDRELPSTAYNSFRNSSINFEEFKLKKEF